MPELTATHLGLLAVAIVLGVVLGWVLRGDRCAREKLAVNAGWQQQIEAQQSEHHRLATQNKSLMEQVSQYQASTKDANVRAKELGDSLKEAFERRDALQRQIKDVRGDLEVAVAQKDQLMVDVESKSAKDKATDNALREKDQKIFDLSRELTSWQSRVPPLVERFRQRDLEAQQLETELQQAQDAIIVLEAQLAAEHTRIEPIDTESLPEGLDASNEPHESGAERDMNELEDQILEPAAEDDAVAGESDWNRGDSHDEVLLDERSINEFVDSRAGISDPFAEAADAEEDESEVPVSSFDPFAGEPFADETFAEELQEDEINGEPADEVIDDLKLIKGVGPAIEKTLHELGIYRFNQIAEMSEYDIDRVAQQLRGFRSRIYREDWIGQARTLQFQKITEPG